LSCCQSKGKAAVAGEEWCASELISGENVLAGGECMVGRPNSGEAAVVGGDSLVDSLLR
jgi:hypothetical protein